MSSPEYESNSLIDVEEFYQNFVKPAVIKLLNRRSIEFFGILLYKLKIEVAEISNKESKDLPFLAVTNGESVILVPREGWSTKRVVYSLCHELQHVLLDHVRGDRLGSRNVELWNISADHIVNSFLYDFNDSRFQSVMEATPGHVFFPDIHRDHPNITVEKLYDLLLKEGKTKTKTHTVKIRTPNSSQPGSQGTNDGDDSEDSNDGEEGSISITYLDIEREGQKYQIVLDTDLSNLPEPKNSNYDNLKKSLMSDARMLWSTSKNQLKGSMPGSIVAQFDEIFKIELPWDIITSNAIEYESQRVTRRSWKYPDFYLPKHIKSAGKHLGTNTEIAIWTVDVSGSVDDLNVLKFISAVARSSHVFDKLIVFIHDHCIQDEFWFTDRVDEDLVFETIRKLRGRGGTSHADVFRRIGEIIEDGELVSVVALLTDFESDVEQIHTQHEWFKEIPSVWVLNTDHEVKFDPHEYTYKVIRIK